jgi:predicted nucleic acid-binding protein
MDDLLLDSSYLLPIFGIRLEYLNFETVFPQLSKSCVVKYNPVSLIEAKWAIIRRTVKLKDLRKALFQNYRQGIFSLQRDSSIGSTILTNSEIEELSDQLLTQYNIRDYFDRQIYSTAAQLQCELLTEDEKLHDLFKKSNLAKPKKVSNWKDLLGRIG